MGDQVRAALLICFWALCVLAGSTFGYQLAARWHNRTVVECRMASAVYDECASEWHQWSGTTDGWIAFGCRPGYRYDEDAWDACGDIWP